MAVNLVPQKRITEIERRTGLRFPKLVAADTFGQ